MKDLYQALSIVLFSLLAPAGAICQTGYTMQPVSGADGVYATVDIDGATVYRSSIQNEGYYPYMYFRTSENISHRTVYLEVTFLDIGNDVIGLEYNSLTRNYEIAETAYNNAVFDSGEKRTAVFKLPNADFRDAQNLETDLRISNSGTVQMHIISAILYLEATPLFLEYFEDWTIPYHGPVYTGDNLVDSDSIVGKVICGYQGWFRAPGDPSGRGWDHYALDDFTDLTVEMWPDMLEYTDKEKYPVPGWKHADSSQVTLFSSANKRTVLRHFQWMEAYGIDGVAVQRFISGGNLDLPYESFRIPSYARGAAIRTGRTFYIMYDMSGCDTTLLVDALSTDWKHFVDSLKITGDERYLHHDGKPVVGIFGFFTDRFSADIANEVLDIFQNDGPYGAFVAASGQWPEPEEHLTDWLQAQARMDAYIPWNVGNYNGDYAYTAYWDMDQDRFSANGVLYMPLIYPGFGWDNLMNRPPGTTYKSRLKGRFMWQQFLDAKQLGAKAVYVAMYDEIDESTAIFKVTNDIPVNHYFSDLEGLNSDFYLLLAGYGTSMMRGEVAVPQDMPDFDKQSQPPIPDIIAPQYGDTVASPFNLSWSPVKHLSGITGYEVEIDGNVTHDTETSKELDLENGIHSFRVRAVNGLDNQGGWSERVNITVNNALWVEEKLAPERDPRVFIQNYPNPFDKYTIFQISIPKSEMVTLEIFNISGKKLSSLINSNLNGGEHKVHFLAEELPAGVYFYRLTAGNTSVIKKAVIVR